MASASFPGPERNHSGYGLGEVDAASPPGGVESHPAVRTKETPIKEERASRNIESARRDMTDSGGKGETSIAAIFQKRIRLDSALCQPWPGPVFF